MSGVLCLLLDQELISRHDKRGLHQRYTLRNEGLHNDSSYRPSLFITHCNIGTENYQEVGVNLNYADDKTFLGCAEIV